MVLESKGKATKRLRGRALRYILDAPKKRRIRRPHIPPHTPTLIGSPALREHIRATAENRPGIYRLHDGEDRVLYVGKSVRVRTRLLSYFRAQEGEKAAELMKEARRAEWEYVPDEFGALVSEMRLIQRCRPRFNVQHKRPRPYAFLKLTLREQAPRLLPVRRVLQDGSLYFGPFARVAAMGSVARELAAVLGLRSCASSTPVSWRDQLSLFHAEPSPGCIRAELGTCLAPCCGMTDARTYLERVGGARRFLEGRGDDPLPVLERQMTDAAARLDFEHAARLRDRRERLRQLRDELAAFRGEVDALSFVYQVPGFDGDDHVYLIRGGRVCEHFGQPTTAAARDASAVRVRNVFGERDPGLVGLSATEAAEILLVAAWFRGRPEERARTVSAREWLAGG
jgi:excinuclease ABC subunit C